MAPWTGRTPALEECGPTLTVRVSSGLLEPLGGSKSGAVHECEAVALLDTGAGISVIQTALARALLLPVLDSVDITTPSDAMLHCPTHAVRVTLPDGTQVRVVAAAVERPELPVDMLLGRDVLAKAVLVYQGHDESFTLAL